MSFLGRKKDKDDKQSGTTVPPNPTPIAGIDPDTGLPPPYEPPDTSGKKAKDAPQAGVFKRLQNYLVDSYNGLYKIVLEPSMPTRNTIALLVVGLIIGMIFAYGVFPTEFTGASPRRMNQDAVEQWVRMVAVGYAEELSYNGETALAVLQQLPNPQQVVASLSNDPNLPDFERSAVQRLQSIQGFSTLTGSVPPQDPGLVGSLVQFIIPILLVVIVTPILVVVWRLLIYPNIVAGIFDAIKRSTNKEYADSVAKQKRELQTLQEQKRLKEEMAKNVVADAELGEPVMQTISIYTKGRNYDDSFAIELGPEHGNQFLGECGASIATEVANEVQSIEFWAFDMATQATLTKIFAAPGALTDPTLQAKVANRVKNPGADIISAEPGAKLTLETDAIRIQGEIVTVAYNDAGGSANSAIENLQLKITSWQKQGAPIGSVPAGGPPPIPPAQPLPDYSDMQFDPPPQMPSATPPPGGRSLDEYDDIQFDPPPPMPGQNPLTPPPLQMPTQGLSPLKPPPLQMPPSNNDEEDEDPFGGTGDFTPLS